MAVIFTVKRAATNHIGTRVVAYDERGNHAVELWDYNASPGTNHVRAASLVADGADTIVCVASDGDAASIFRT